jgi:energy-coupling factor transporter ATP-binding protein EcfA2
MFERFQAINYQVLEDLRLRLDPGVTVIVGRNDAGKSAALRAFEWLCTNRPPGNADIRHGTEGMAARLWVDGHVIERHKSATSTNSTARPSRRLGTTYPPRLPKSSTSTRLTSRGSTRPRFGLPLPRRTFAGNSTPLSTLGSLTIASPTLPRRYGTRRRCTGCRKNG